MRRILRWLPEERPTTEELMFDPWLMEGLGLSDGEIAEIRAKKPEVVEIEGFEGGRDKKE